MIISLTSHQHRSLTREAMRCTHRIGGWWRGLAVTRWSWSTKLLYATPG